MIIDMSDLCNRRCADLYWCFCCFTNSIGLL